MATSAVPTWISPMLVRSGRGVPVDLADWAVEPKWDGLRYLACLANGALRLTSRWRNDLTPLFPRLADLPPALRSLRLQSHRPREENPRLPRPDGNQPIRGRIRKRVHYYGFIGPLIEAVKELDARLAALEARLADQPARASE